MDLNEKCVISLIKSAITGEEIVFSDDCNINKILKIANKHAVLNLVVDGLSNCKKDSLISDKALNDLCSGMSLSKKQIHAAEKLKNEFEKNHIDYMFLKGLNLKNIYPKPENREMGDLDILIKTNQYELIRKILINLGYDEKEESDHELIWCKGDLYLELHKHLIPTNNKDYIKYFKNGWQFAKIVSDDSCEYCMSPDDEYIFLLTHLAKHFRDGGIGIRHFVDLWIYKNKYSLNNEYIEKKLALINLNEFNANVNKTIDVWFNGVETDKKTEFITRYVLSSGTFGSNVNHIYSDGLVAMLKNGSVAAGRKDTVFRLIFPTYKRMAQKYPILEKFPFLLPFSYFPRWYEAIFIRKGIITKYRGEIKQQTEENVLNYMNNLKYMGISFNDNDFRK